MVFPPTPPAPCSSYTCECHATLCNYESISCRSNTQRAPNPPKLHSPGWEGQTEGYPGERVQIRVCLFLYCWNYPGVRLQLWVCLICVISTYSNGTVQIHFDLLKRDCANSFRPTQTGLCKFQEKKFANQYQVPCKTSMGKNHRYKCLCLFFQETIWTKRAKKIEKCPPRAHAKGVVLLKRRVSAF